MWKEEFVDDGTPLVCKGLKLAKKIKISSQLNVPEGQYQLLMDVLNEKEGPNATFTVGKIRESNNPKLMVVLDNKPIGSWSVDAPISGGSHSLTIEISPCFGWVNTKGDTVTGPYNFLMSLYPAGARTHVFRNEILSKSIMETGQHYTTKEYLLKELQ